MNKVFKVIWSEARNAYVVVSEIAKNHGSKSCSTKKLLTMLIATGVMTCASMAPAMAAPNVDASATVNVGKKAAVDVAENAKVNVKKDAKVNVEEGSNVSVDKNVTIGKGAVSSPYVGQTGNVAIGEKALAWNGNGLQEALMDFGQGGAKVKSFFGIPYGADIVDGTKLPGSIAIGKNTVARSGSTMIGDHGYTGKIGDTTITPDGNGIMKYNNDVYSTTIGANSFNSGALASVTGVFSIASSKYDGENYKIHAVQNTGATIYGSMNSIESATSDAKYSGIASSVLGFANKTQNANAALIWGTGNEVTNSIESIDIDYNGWNKLSVAGAQQKAIEAMQSSKYAGGSVMAIGGGNKADYAKYSQLTGVQNKVTGTEAKTAKYDFVNGYQNTVTNASDVTVIGIKNEVTADGNKVIGDNHKVSGKDNVIFGSADKVTETTVSNAVVLGHNAKVTDAGGVALGSGSVADRANAVSVGRRDANRQIINVAAGTEDTDAVNVSQLKDVKAEAEKHSVVTDGANITVTPEKATDGHMQYKVALKNDITLAGDDPDAFVSISGSKGTIWTSGSVTAGSVAVGTAKADGTTPFFVDSNGAFYAADGKFSVDKDGNANANSIQTNALNSKYNLSVGTANVNGTMPFFVNSNGAFYAANGKLVVDKDGKVTATEGKIGNVVLDNGVFTGHSALRDGELFVGDASGNYSQITTKGAKLGKVTVAEDGKISGVAAGAVTADSTDAVNGSQLHAVATEAGKHSKVVSGNNINVEETDVDGQKFYKVNMNKDIMLGDLTGKNVSISGTNGTIEATGAIATKDRVHADNGAKLADIDVTGNKISNGASSIVLDGSNVKVNDKVTFDQNGNIAGVNSIQTNALNAKYNLSVGTANENGIMPFFVNSNGAFYGANNNFSVDKDGKVTATAGEIGNVVLQNGVYTGHSALRDAELFVGDADGNYSQITPKSAKLGQVTIDEKGNMAGVNSIQTNALNAKYNLSVGTANENGIMPFFVNSNGAFYGANNNFSVDKDGKVTATEGEIGNVVLDNGVFTGHSALRDGELFVGDASGNYSQITTKGAKLGKVTVAEDGKISGVAAGAVTADSTDAVNGSQLHAVATEAGKHSKVVSGNNINVEETDVDGQKFYKVNMNKDIMLGDLTGKNVSISGTNGTIEATGAIATKDRVHADNGAKLADIDVTGNKISNGASSIVLDGSNVKVNDKVTFDQNGNIAGVNSIQTNALNAKYNLSVGTANENGIMPFFVNSNGAFYGANNNFSVDKDGKVTATAGEIGNVVLQNGVYTGHSALRDAELFVGDADGNYSQITPKSAKLGQVTIDEKGNMAGVNSIQTNALNAKYNLSVGTANENGIMPFFVNSNGAFYGANNNFSVDKDGKVTATEGEIGNVVLDNGVFTGHSALRDGELFVGDASGNYSQITTKGAKLGKVTVAEDGKISGVAAGAVTADSTDAVNGSQLHAVATEAGKHSKVVSGNNINVEETDVDGQKFYKVNMNKDIMLGDLTGKNVSISGTNGTIEATGAIATKDRVHADNGAKLADIDVTGNKISNGASSIVLDGSNVKVNDKVTIDQDGKISGVAAGEISSTSTDAINGSQLKETNDRVAANETAIKNNTEAISKLDGRVTANETAIKNNADAIGNLNTRVDGVEKLAKQHTTVAAAGDNITVTEDTNKDGGKEYKVALDKDINLDSVTTGQTVMNNDGLKVGKDVSVTATAVTAGQTSISNDGLKVNGKTYVSDSGLNANDQKITKVADGDISETSKDAVNGSQLYKTNQEVANNATNISSLSHSISNLDNRVNKVGAGAAALAALHPLDFDPDAKWDFAAGYGNYRGANAAAVGAYYRPNEDTMFSVGGTFGNGENMVNAGVSFKLGSGSSHVSTSRVAMAKEIKELRGELEAMKSAMLDANAGKKIDTSKLQLFPDVPQNHWAYEYVAQLAGNGMIEGYPDGNFAGDRPMTRYEFAAILYRAMAKGAVLSDKILSEFSHELEYFTVDTIAKDKAGNPTIQRVRTVKENKNK